MPDLTAREIGEQPVACAPKNLTCFVSTTPERDQFVESLVDLGDQRAAGHGHDDVVGQAPAKLLGDLIADGLRAFGIVGPQIDVHEAPVVAFADLRAEAIHLIVISGDADQARAEDLRAQHLGRLEIGGDEDPGLEAHARGLRGHGIGQIARGRAAHHLEAEGLGLRQRHGHDAILERKRRETHGVVLQVETREPEARAEARRRDQAASCPRAVSVW